MNSPFLTIALIGKHKNPEIAAPLLSLAEHLTSKHYKVLLDHLSASNICNGKYPALSLEEIRVGFFFYWSMYYLSEYLKINLGKQLQIPLSQNGTLPQSQVI